MLYLLFGSTLMSFLHPEQLQLKPDSRLVHLLSFTPLYTSAFLHAKAATALAHLSYHNSVRLSVCPSHWWISQKWCKL